MSVPEALPPALYSTPDSGERPPIAHNINISTLNPSDKRYWNRVIGNLSEDQPTPDEPTPFTPSEEDYKIIKAIVSLFWTSEAGSTYEATGGIYLSMDGELYLVTVQHVTPPNLTGFNWECEVYFAGQFYACGQPEDWILAASDDHLPLNKDYYLSVLPLKRFPELERAVLQAINEGQILPLAMEPGVEMISNRTNLGLYSPIRPGQVAILRINEHVTLPIPDQPSWQTHPARILIQLVVENLKQLTCAGMSGTPAVLIYLEGDRYTLTNRVVGIAAAVEPSKEIDGVTCGSKTFLTPAREFPQLRIRGKNKRNRFSGRRMHRPPGSLPGGPNNPMYK